MDADVALASLQGGGGRYRELVRPVLSQQFGMSYSSLPLSSRGVDLLVCRGLSGFRAASSPVIPAAWNGFCPRPPPPESSPWRFQIQPAHDLPVRTGNVFVFFSVFASSHAGQTLQKRKYPKGCGWMLAGSPRSKPKADCPSLILASCAWTDLT